MSNRTGRLSRLLSPWGLLLFIGWLILPGTSPRVFAQTVNFNFLAAPTFVATTGESEVLGEIILSADVTCGTHVDTSCISSAGSIQATYTNVNIDNSTATGITVCEVIATITTCNAAGTYLTGTVSTGNSPQGGVVSFGVKAGANFGSGDQVRISGVRGRIADSILLTPGMTSTAVLTAAPVIAAGFSPAAATVARSATALTVALVGDPLVPCVLSDPVATVQISEGFTTAFVDQGDPGESTYPGAPANPRPSFGATNSTRFSLKLTGLVSGITVTWPTSVPALVGNAVLDLVSQSTDGSLATYVFGTPDQAASDTIQEAFNIQLGPANFTFSGNGPIAGDVTIQGQLSPPSTPTNVRPRYNDPLQPVPAAEFLALRRCNTTTGTLTVQAEVDGLGWNGGLSFDLIGPTPISGVTVPTILEGMLAGTYTLQYNSGGPNGATFTGYSPNQVQNLAVGGTRLFTMDFTGPTVANLKLSSTSIQACPLNNIAVGTFQLSNATTDLQIIPGGTAFNFAFSSPVVGAPVTTGLGNPGFTLAGANLKFTIPGSISLPPGGVITFASTKLDLSSAANGQNVTAQLTTVPAAAVQLSGNQAVLATINTQHCATPPPIQLPPSFTAANVTNGASFQTGMSPGSISTVFGTNLSNATGVNLSSGLPLTRNLLGVTVSLNGIQAPIFALDNVNGQEQINFQVPWELAGQNTASMVINNNGQVNDAVTVNLLAAFPGLFTTDGTTGAILHGGQANLVTSNNPARKGEFVTLFATGLGAVSPTPATGSATPVLPQSNTQLPLIVTVGGSQAAAPFSGLAPGFVGLYQVNIQIPADVSSGSLDVNVQVNGQSSNAVKIFVQ